MSKKDFDEYYNELCSQREQLILELDELQKIAAERAIEPERLENMKKAFQPVLDTYQMISWVAFLLNKPTRTQKQKNYNKAMKNKISKLDPNFSKESLIKRNDRILKDTHTSMHGE